MRAFFKFKSYLSLSIFFIAFNLILFTEDFAQGTENESRFDKWLNDFKTEALDAGISQQTLDQVLTGVKPREKIIRSDRKQPEFTNTLDTYLANAINPLRIKKGRKLLRENWRLFKKLDADYQVQSRFLIALWGIETDFGRNMGNVPVAHSLVTLAYDSRRGPYFRRELLDALRIIDRQLASFDQMNGSWAGAVGQLQFMPSVMLKYGVDYDQNGKIDLWRSRADALASAANYLTRRGWEEGWTWGREVLVPAGFDPGLKGLDIERSLSYWQKKGVRRLNGEDLPNVDIQASLIRPDGDTGRSFLVYENYRKILVWNRSHKFAIAVGLLADLIGE